MLDILSRELERNFAGLKKKADIPPYFVAYSVVESKSDVISATLGALQTRNRSHRRLLDVTVRVGDPKLDNYHSVRGESPQFTSASVLPLEDLPDPIRRKLWLDTDRTFRLASQRLVNLRTSTQMNVAGEDQSDDFSREEAVVHVDPPQPVSTAGDEWVGRARKWSAGMRKYSGVLASSVTVLLQRETKYLVNTEGTRLQHGRGFARIMISAQGKAADGMDLASSESFEAEEASRLPKDAEVAAAVNRVGAELQALLDAPLVEPFVGPAILSGRAAGVFFHEIFGHRIEGHRQKDETDGQTFTKSVNAPVLPEFLSIVFDPTRRSSTGVDLNGSYSYDDEGVKARPVTLVEKGILKTFLMSRSPIKGFSTSNGHGRRQPGREVVSRQSNLIVESSREVSNARLRELLINEIRRQKKPYGLYFKHVTGGFTMTGRRGIQAFKVVPLVVYRVYPDGRPDELVRGVDIVGTPLASFSRIIATSDQPEVFNGYCGAESGNVPVAAVSPAILVSEIEIQKKEKGNDRPPLLPAPLVVGGLQ
ncbi:MAG: peptidase U62 [Acidobacteria bacterium]|nr:peptidase U62 [Acidobacteriota bacterium]